MLMLDAPDHTRCAASSTRRSRPAPSSGWRRAFSEIVDELLDAVAGHESFDLIEAFAGPLPVIVIAEMLGVDPADRDDFKRWSDHERDGFNPMLTDEQRAVHATRRVQIDAYFRRSAIAARRAAPRDDLISALIAVEEAGDQLTDDEIVTMCGLLLAAGNVTTTDLIGNGVLDAAAAPATSCGSCAMIRR